LRFLLFFRISFDQRKRARSDRFGAPFSCCHFRSVFSTIQLTARRPISRIILAVRCISMLFCVFRLDSAYAIYCVRWHIKDQAQSSHSFCLLRRLLTCCIWLLRDVFDIYYVICNAISGATNYVRNVLLSFYQLHI